MRLVTPLVTLAVLAAALIAAGPQMRPARATDLPGVWLMVGLTNDAPFDPADKVFAPYQIFAFDKKGGMKHMTSAKPFTEGQLALFSAAPQVNRYTVSPDGTLELSNPSWDAPLKYQCRVVAKSESAADAKSVQVGDLLMVGLDDRGREAWSKVLRKTQ
jgi:hypothetical protein